MKTGFLLSAVVALASATPTVRQPPSKRSDLTAVTVSGNAFWQGDTRFYLRGIDYQPGGAAANTDPLADTKVCERDIAKFKDLGVNVIRVYAVDNSLDHDECMSALNDAGIYLVLDVNNPAYSINRADPGPSYNTAYLQSVFATVEMFAKYKNTLAFFSGNEVINDEEDTDKSAPYVKAVTRDMKKYMSSRNLRAVPVGYSAADVSSNRMQTAQYMNCGSDDERSDFFAFNDYSWCNSDFTTSGWDVKVKNFTDYGLPIFLSEYGCIKSRPRKFDELTAMMSDKMSSVYSGGLLYEYSIEENDFGIVSIGSNDKVTTISEYGLFKTALSENPAPTGDGGADSTTHSKSCPTSDASWQVNASLVPEMPAQADKYMTDGAGDGPGLDGDGSQDRADSGTATAGVTGEAASSTGSSDGDDDSAASALGPLDLAPICVTGAAIIFTLFGTLLL
ncbi:1,3-beta-glucanosyltransferase Gel1 [Dactylonectria estremocensis]|uniref:1,3-beta-glucanosyltransferase n=1 Tax=Dactylonectria estremocensis TaxID=1079267 RepID=A0A9P9EZB6_9HYPO|nr:1,3-beta-glucanosyltransferase Gel1 [Dactylonectria estremocensis]